MQTSSRNKIFSIYGLILLFAGFLPVACRAGENLQVFYSNDVRSELEACG